MLTVHFDLHVNCIFQKKYQSNGHQLFYLKYLLKHRNYDILIINHTIKIARHLSREENQTPIQDKY